MKKIVIPTLILASMVGCNFQNKQKIEAHQRWSRARAMVVCGVGGEYLRVGDLDKAKASASEALSLDRTCVPARILMAKVLLEKGRYLEAAEHLRPAEAEAPNNAEVPYLIGVALEKRCKYDEALRSYQKARALSPANDAYVTASAEALVAAGKPQLALELIETRLERTDGTAVMLALAGELAMLVGKPAKACAFYQRCLDGAPEGLAAIEGFAKASFFAGRHGEALAALKTLEAHSEYKAKASWVYIMIGDCHMSLGKPQAARGAYEQAGSIDPAEPGVWVSLGKAALACGDVATAISAAKRVLALEETSIDAKVLLAYALLAGGRSADAVGVLAPVLRGSPGNATVLCVLGRCYDSLGQRSRAVSCYVQALRSQPDHLLAKQLLAATGLETKEVR